MSLNYSGNSGKCSHDEEAFKNVKFCEHVMLVSLICIYIHIDVSVMPAPSFSLVWDLLRPTPIYKDFSVISCYIICTTYTQLSSMHKYTYVCGDQLYIHT